VCSTELAVVARSQQAFASRGVKLIALSASSLEEQGWREWLKDVEAYAGTRIEFPIIADPDRKVAGELNMVDVETKDSKGRPVNARALHVIRPDKKVGRSQSAVQSNDEKCCSIVG
jgi:alkyl hydroperoxide reductase subunit AhpC